MTRVSVGELVGAKVLVMSDGYRTKRAELASDGYRILRVADVLDDRVQLDGPDFVNPSFARAIGIKAAKAGDVLLTTKGTVGRVAVMPPVVEKVVYSPQLCFFRVVDSTVLDSGWLSYWFRTPEFQRQASHRKDNTDMAAYINLADVRSLSFRLPPIDEQRGIAEVLGALDDKIAANSDLLAVAEDLGGALVSSSITDERVLLGAISSVTMGSSPPGASYNVEGKGTVFYQGVRDFGVRSPSNRVWTTEPVRLAEAGDTLVSVRAPVGRTNVATETTCLGRGLAGLRSQHPSTLFHLLRSVPSIWAHYEAEGTVFGSINKAQLTKLVVPAIEKSKQSGLERRLAALDGKAAAALRESDLLARTRDALLPLLMSGKVRVKDAELVVGEVL
jgi:type I restriction enzyme S subunit